ncbi:MAG: NusG domain II-containing protein [Lachnospira sp.]|nr:NusG domain II-containing protein [Lachnospira sp.]
MSEKKNWKNDLILVGVLLAVSVLAFVIINMFVKKPGDKVIVKVDGKVVHELSLSQDTEVIVEGYQGGYNEIIIEYGYAKVNSADCPDELCVHSGTIDKSGETIVCLPHRVVVEVISGNNEIDAEVR